MESSPLFAQLKINTKLFQNCLSEMSDEIAQTRPDEKTNHASFLALHLFEARWYMCLLLKIRAKNPFREITKDALTPDDIKEYPPLQDVIAAWKKLSEALLPNLMQVSEERWKAPSQKKFPGVEKTNLGGITFLLQHESYHIGQLGLIRKYFGLPLTNYD
jgi:uncharacterized damage-inducible protein DinB